MISLTFCQGYLLGHIKRIRKFEEKRLLDSSCLLVYLSVVSRCGRMQQLDFHWTAFREMFYVRLFRKSVEKIQALLKSDKNIGYFT